MVNAVLVPEWLKKLPFAPAFYPTETEFADPIAYISKIEKEASAFGICKIIPPIPRPSKKFVFTNLNRSLSKRPELDSELNFQKSNSGFSKSAGGANVERARAVFTTRQQELGYCVKKTKTTGNVSQSSAKKQVWQSGEVYTLDQFEAKAKGFSREILGKIEEISPLVVETLFWKKTSEKPIYVEYANDVPGSAFSEPIVPVRRINMLQAQGRRVDDSSRDGSNTTLEPGNMSSDASTPNHGIERTAGWKLSNSPWNLQVISRSAGSLTRFMLDDIPGVTSPMIYIGMLFSWFAWHVEDHELHSLNFLHIGSPKTWYAVPGMHAFAFEEVIRNEALAEDNDTLAALGILGEKTTIVSPEVITRRGIPCCRLVQNPGEFVVTFPRAYHIGFSHGFNCGEAANFATPEWLNIAKEAAVRRTIMDHLPMLSHQQLLYHLTMSFVSRVPISLIPGVRSSRLRNRQKEARELLVKGAFIEDVLRSNDLVNRLLQKDSSFRAVLWNSSSLLPFGRESVSQTHTTRSESDRPAICLKDNDQIHIYSQITLQMQMLDDLDIVDLSSDFEISSGTLPCVACGILGFPYMCVVQPSRKASKEILPPKHISFQGENEATQSRKLKPANISEDSSSAEFDERWNSSCGFLRPRIFCLEHAVQAEELLRPKGGANILVICHSDFQKIKPTAWMVSEEIGYAFGYKEVNLDFASIQDLSLINLAIDDVPNEGWTSNLGINLKHFVKARNISAAKPMEHKLKLRAPLADANLIPDMSKIMWSCRKPRRKRKRSIIQEKNTEAVQAKEENLKSSGLFDTKTDDITMENADSSKLRKYNVCFQYSRKKYRSKSSELSKVRSDKDCLPKPPYDAQNNICADSVSSVPASAQGASDRSEATKSGVESCILIDHEYQQPSVETAAGFVSLQIRNCKHKESKAAAEGTAQNSEISEVSDAEYPCLSAVISLESSTDRGKHRENGNNLRDEVNNGDIAKGKISEVPEHTTTSVICPDQIPMDVEVSDGKTLDATHENDKEGHESDSLCLGILASACLVNRPSEKIETSNVDAKTTSRNQKGGSREAMQPGYNNLNHDEFVKSPCEGLRPRMRKGESTSQTGMDLNNISGEPLSKKKKASDTNICNTGQSQKQLKTKAELSMQKQNRGGREGCGKQFRSRSKAVKPESVDDEEQRFECTWKGCKMSFNSDSARTEHLQTHTGSRPFRCESEGCGLAFRYVAELSRHKRWTGHHAI